MAMLHQARRMGLPLMNILRFKEMPVLEQLHLEEKLLRTSSDNWCIINDGTNSPTIVMGKFGKPSELLELGPVSRDRVPVIRRPIGGGTVVVDNDTIFVSLICNKDAVPEVQPYPRPLMCWNKKLYAQVFQGTGDFQLRENDYVFGDRKFGGNAQSITKIRWIHHSSFLWDYEIRNMAYLKIPARAPKYRLARDHADFVCRMKEYLPRKDFLEKTLKALETHFSMKPANLEAVGANDGEEMLHSARLLSQQELEDGSECPLESVAG